MKDLIENIYSEIVSINSYATSRAIPQSDEFFDMLSEKYNLVPFTVPILIGILENSNMIFSFNTVEKDRKKKMRQVRGYVAARGDIIKKLKLFFQDELVQMYTGEFTKRISAEKVFNEFTSIMDEYNGTDLGRVGRTAVMLRFIEDKLKLNISNYSRNVQMKMLKDELEKANEISFFMNQTIVSDDLSEKNASKSRLMNSDLQNGRAESNSENNSLEKALVVYGVEFYTHLCFRDYKFSHVLRLVDEGLVKRKEDLMVIKKMLQKERASADNDFKLQSYAGIINELERSVNKKLK